MKRNIILAISGIIITGVIAGYFLFNQYQQEQKKKAVVKVGIMLPLSGPGSHVGYGSLKGIQLARKELGKKNIEIIQADSACNKDRALQRIKEFAEKGVVAVVGGSCSVESLTVLPELEKYNMVLLSPTSSSPKLTIPNDYFFRVVPPDTYQGKFAAEMVYGKGLKTVVLFHSDEPYGTGLTSAFKETYEQIGGKVLNELTFTTDTIDLKKEIDIIKANKPDAIYLVCNCNSSPGAALNLMKQAGLTIPTFGSEGLYDKTFLKDIRGAAEGLTIVTLAPATKAFEQALTAEFGTEGFRYSAPQGYDAYKALDLALATGARTGKEIKQALAQVEFDGVSSRIAFDENGDVTENFNYAVYQVRNGEFVSIDQ